MKKQQRFRALFTRSIMSLAIALLILTQPASGAGVTILTHGLQSGSDRVAWLDSMRAAIEEVWIKQNSNQFKDNLAYIVVDEIEGNLISSAIAWPSENVMSDLSEILVIVNWSAVSFFVSEPDPMDSIAPVDGEQTFFATGEVAAHVLGWFTQSRFGSPPLAQLPIHIVGHSRGGSLATELSRVLGERGIWVDQVTTLDPHPILTDGITKIYENVLFADNYWQDFFDFIHPDGEFIPGAYNRFLEDSDLSAGGYGSPHSDIHLWYHGTVDKRYRIDITDGEAVLTSSLRNTWFEPNEFLGTTTGYRFSRFAESFGGSIRNSSFTPVAGGDPVLSGYSFLLGGGGSRWELNKSAAVWPNLITIDILRDGVKLDAGDWYVPIGDSIELQFWYVSYNSFWSAEFFIDSDLNPYNGFASQSPIISSDVGQIFTFPVGLTGSLNTADIAPNDSGYYFCGRIRDVGGQHVRYLYAKPRIIFFEPPSKPTVTIEAIDTYIDVTAPTPMLCRETSLLAGSGLKKFTFMQFDFSGLGQKIVEARLHLWVDDHVPAPVSLSLHRVIGETPWSECQVTTLFNARFLVQGFASRAFSGSGWHEIDITPQVRDWADGTTENNGFVITDIPAEVGGYVIFGSAESTHPPFLEIDTTSCCKTPGDATGDANTNIADVVFLISWLFAGGGSPACCAEGSANGDGKINIGDVTYIISWLFSGGPFPVCGLSTFGC